MYILAVFKTRIFHKQPEYYFGRIKTVSKRGWGKYMGSFRNYYRILDVSYDATFTEIKEAYRKKVKEVHPDTEKGNAEQFKRVKEAYEILNNAEKRKKYDDLLFNVTHKLKQEAPASIKILNMRKGRKQGNLSSVFMNAAIILIGILGNVYLDRKK